MKKVPRLAAWLPASHFLPPPRHAAPGTAAPPQPAAAAWDRSDLWNLGLVQSAHGHWGAGCWDAEKNEKKIRRGSNIKYGRACQASLFLELSNLEQVMKPGFPDSRVCAVFMVYRVLRPSMLEQLRPHWSKV